MKIPNNANKLINYLTEAGYSAYAVGGCVRDGLMGIDAKDIDITTSAMPNELEAVLDSNNIKYVETGIKHGTVTAIIEHIPYEITTFRTDGEYNDNRHPHNVEFVTDISKDLGRRDFTINAIAFNDVDGFVDLYDGRADIQNKIIRAVGDPCQRFDEDALRIMRALRFSSVLGFQIEPNTKKAIFEKKELLSNIATERVFAELIKLLLGNNVEQVLLDYRDVFAVIIPELLPCFDFPQRTKWHIYDVYTHIVKAVASADKVDYIRLALLLHDIGKPYCLKTDDRGVDHFKGHPAKSCKIAKNILLRFHVSNEMLKKVLVLIENHDFYIRLEKPNIKRWLRTLGDDLTLDYIDLKIADLKAHNLKYSRLEIDTLYEIKNLTKQIIDSNEPYRICDLAVDGNDLKNIGYSGPSIANELEILVETVSENPEKNTKEILIDIAKKSLS